MRTSGAEFDPDGATWHIDHVIPKSRYSGSPYDLSNIVLSCTKCNLSKKDSIGMFPQHGTTYADGSLHSKEKEETLMSMVEEEIPVENRQRSSLDINIRQAQEKYDVSPKTIRRAIWEGKIGGVYKVKEINGPTYYFPEHEIAELWGEATVKDKNISMLEVEVQNLLDEKSRTQLIIKTQQDEIIRLKEKINLLSQVVLEKL